MDEDALVRLLDEQDGVVAWRQLRAEAGLTKDDIARMVRRRELTRVHDRVYVDHTGPLSWEQRARAAVLYAAPAALCLDSAAPSPPVQGPIHVAIDQTRRLAGTPGVRVHRMCGLADRVLWNLSLPRTRPEDTALDRAHQASSELDGIGILSEVVGRSTTAARVRAALPRHPRLRRRAWIGQVLDDLVRGVCSVLEHGYLVRVERAHGLPEADRQSSRRTPGGSEYRDVEYTTFGLVVELDGRVGHEAWEAGGRDADRDLDDAADGRLAVRLRWLQVFGTPCRTAERVARILRRRGWTGRPRGCSPQCPLG